MSRKLKAAVIGVGNMGQHHARIYHELPDTDLLAVCDSNVTRGKQIAGKFKTRYFKSYQRMLHVLPEIEIISVVVPTFLHYQVAIDLIEKGKNILLEKPIANDYRDGKMIIKKASQNGVKLAVGHIERYNPAVIKIKELIDQKKMGRIISVIARRVGGFPSQIKDANVILDLAVHDVDIINFLVGEKPEKYFINKRKIHAKTQEDAGEIFLTYKKATGFIQINWVTPVKIRKLSITGTRGYAELNYLTQDIIFHQLKIEREVSDFGELVKLHEASIERIGVIIEEPLKLEIVDFIKAVQENRLPQVKPEDALESLRICLNLN